MIAEVCGMHIPHTSSRAAPFRLCATGESSSSREHRVYLYNDSFNMREYVSRVLMMVCDISEEDSSEIMMQANWGGRAVVGTWDKPLAEYIYDGMCKAGLSADIEVVETDEPVLS